MTGKSNSGALIVVEDDATDVALIGRVLDRNGIPGRAEFLRDGQALLDRLGIGGGQDDAEDDGLPPPQLVVLDLKLPKIGGLEVLRRLDADARWRGVPVVVLTSSSDPGDIKTAYQRGASSYVVKPVDSDQFNRKVGEIFSYWCRTNEVARQGR